MINDKKIMSGNEETVKYGIKSIENEYYQVFYNEDSGCFTAVEKKNGKAFLVNGQGYENGGSAEVVEIEDGIYGKGKSIRITYKSGNMDHIMLYSDLQFLLLQTHAVNKSAEEVILSKTKTFHAKVDLGIPSTQLKAFGTAGLDELANYGSYAYMAVVDPATSQGVVSGWITHERGDGIVFTDLEGDSAILNGQIDYGRLLLKENSNTEFELFAVGYFEDALTGFEAYADAIKAKYNIVLPEIPTVYCTWYDCGMAGTEEYIKEVTDFVDKNLKPFGHNVIQLDDGWQLGTKRNGPAKVFYDSNPDGEFPKGMKYTADYIKEKGITPGIWLMPFAADEEEPFFQEHIDWLVKNPDGKPMVSRWGGATLDMSYGPAKNYLADALKHIVHDWGFKYLKMDGLYTGTATDQIYINDKYREDNLGIPEFYDKDKTPIEIYRDGLKLVRDTVGDNVFLLGCCVRQNMRSFGGSFGLVDAMRIGPDNASRPDRILRGPIYGTQTYFLHGRVWYNDPDPMYVRESVPYHVARALASWQTLSGQLNTSSDNYSQLPPERLEILKRTMPNHGLKPRPVDLFENRLPSVWVLNNSTEGQSKYIVGLFNWETENSKTVTLSLSKLGLPVDTACVAFDFWSNNFVGPIDGKIEVVIKPCDCMILSLIPVSNIPKVISTSRHITQGVIDLVEEKWDATTNTLEGTSIVVAGDPYEIRIVGMEDEGVWNAEKIVAFSDNIAGNISASVIEQNGAAIRVRINSAVSGKVGWKVSFTKSIIENGNKGFHELSDINKCDQNLNSTFKDGNDASWEEPTDF